MLDPDAQARFNKSCSDAAFGYATATGAAYAEMTGKAIEFWAQSFQSLSDMARQEPAEPRSWYRKPVDGEIFPPARMRGTVASAGTDAGWPFAEFAKLNPFAAFMPFAQSTAPGAIPAIGPLPLMAKATAEAFPRPQDLAKAYANPFWPMTAWWTFAQSKLPQQAWPMAFGMLAAGVPSSVAYPAAEANSAAMDAARTATASLDQAFANYRSTGGHATAQVINAGPFMVAFAIAPVGAAALMPWLNVPTSG